MLAAQGVIPRRVIGDEVEDHLETLFVRGIDEGAEFLLRAEFRVHCVIVLHRIGATQSALAVLLPDRVDRHEPQYVDAQFLQARQLLLRGGESAVLGEMTGVDLVQDRIARPFGMLDRDGLSRLPCIAGRLLGRARHRIGAARDESCCGCSENELTHWSSPRARTPSAWRVPPPSNSQRRTASSRSDRPGRKRSSRCP